MLFILLISCSEHDDDKLINRTDVLGTWRTIEYTQIGSSFHSMDDNGLVVEWGIWYIMDFQFISDGVLEIKSGNFGQWEIDEVGAKLYIYDTDKKSKLNEFDISIDDSGLLVLRDDYQILKHKRLE